MVNIPSDLITFIETLVTTRNLLNETIIQIEIIEKLINANNKKISENNNFDNRDDSSCSSNGMSVKLIPTVPTPQNKGK
ncbi:hypothetical protein RirG_062920 [Rhizophagus irregularis DAOM 197198w]|uniref:Uncharacterized protein n=1 Tax=Rhizophagus irregularis (strain DAOM 197198w) TaxID=1432141 RepID=A0A015K0L0_RHIIW|nr:hypothetical protein RirG_062980 [Rhizophagus irregularis DAOM 197198w]EXX73136.1 hypothetical protein RirG_062840 [Rhizophagus irregularis DAOM 197198w]EXX73144.1 hypothetical protein RirG_062920 [Rhizophagus irregularis DAOM 197198w]